jgi:hypothetical protein
MMRDGGVVHRLRLKNWPYLGQDVVKNAIVGVDLKAVAPLLVLLSSSVMVSVGVLLLERGKFFCSRRTLRRTRWQRNICRQLSAAPPKLTHSDSSTGKIQSAARTFH